MGNVAILGLLGGVGSGKSTVARAFADLGATILDADQIAHEVLTEQPIINRIRTAFGNGVITPDGLVDRKRLADIVFEQPPRLTELQAIVHPRVRQHLLASIEEIAAAARVPAVIVLDAPLLLESELNALCDRRLFIDTPYDLRLARVRQTRGWSEDELRRREKNQQPLAEKLAAADYKILNTGPLDPILARVGVIYGELLHSANDIRSVPGRGSPHPQRSTDSLS